MIYLVEDDDSIRELVIYTLHSTGMEAQGFAVPSAFWTAMAEQEPDLVLLDIMLPEEDGLEVLNGSTSVAACQKAARYAQELGLCTMGSSDCHVPEKVGVCATWFPEEIRTMEEFLEALKKGGMKPAYYEDGSYHILEVQEYGNGYPEIGF